VSDVLSYPNVSRDPLVLDSLAGRQARDDSDSRRKMAKLNGSPEWWRIFPLSFFAYSSVKQAKSAKISKNKTAKLQREDCASESSMRKRLLRRETT
jgi:hypothetical protein